MEASVERKSSLRAPLLVAVVAGLHVVAVGAFLVIQGCGTKQPMVEPPPAPVLPPSQQAATAPAAMPKAVFQPPVAVEAAPSSVEAAGGQTYTVASGDSLSRIASRHGVSTREIIQLNNIKDPNKLRVGQKLLLPSYASPQAPSAAKPARKSEPKTAARPAAKAAVAGAGEYIVVSGDSLSKIAVKHGTTVKALREANSLKSDMIRVGQKLVLPGSAKAAKAKPVDAPAAAAPSPAPAPAPVPAPAPEASAPAVAPAPEAPAAPAAMPAPVVSADPLAAPDMPFEYTVSPGETLDDVARKFAVLKQEIMDFNGITDPATVVSGRKLKIPTATP